MNTGAITSRTCLTAFETAREHAPALLRILQIGTGADIDEAFRRIGPVAADVLDEMLRDWADRG